MVNDVMSNVKNLDNEGKITNKEADRILKQLEKFDFDPKKTDEYLKRAPFSRKRAWDTFLHFTR